MLGLESGKERREGKDGGVGKSGEEMCIKDERI